jgi:ribonuclease HI
VRVASGLEIYTDGACPTSRGPGGWAFVVYQDDQEIGAAYGGEVSTTSNRMELAAAAEALESLTEPSTATVHTDSQYVQRGITEWLPTWKKKGWVTATYTKRRGGRVIGGGEPIRNQDLWRRLDEAGGRHEVAWRWVRGHAGVAANERVDELAVMAAQQARDTGEPGLTAVRSGGLVDVRTTSWAP